MQSCCIEDLTSSELECAHGGVLHIPATLVGAVVWAKWGTHISYGAGAVVGAGLYLYQEHFVDESR